MKANYGRVGDETHMKWARGVFVAEQTVQEMDKIAAGKRLNACS
jgi:hypothetical protein